VSCDLQIVTETIASQSPGRIEREVRELANFDHFRMLRRELLAPVNLNFNHVVARLAGSGLAISVVDGADPLQELRSRFLCPIRTHNAGGELQREFRQLANWLAGFGDEFGLQPYGLAQRVNGLRREQRHAEGNFVAKDFDLAFTLGLVAPQAGHRVFDRDDAIARLLTNLDARLSGGNERPVWSE